MLSTRREKTNKQETPVVQCPGLEGKKQTKNQNETLRVLYSNQGLGQGIHIYNTPDHHVLCA